MHGAQDGRDGSGDGRSDEPANDEDDDKAEDLSHPEKISSPPEIKAPYRRRLGLVPVFSRAAPKTHHSITTRLAVWPNSWATTLTSRPVVLD